MTKLDFGTIAALLAGLGGTAVFLVDPSASKGQGMILAFFFGGLLGTVIRDHWRKRR